MNIEKVLKRINDFLPPKPAVKFSVVKGEAGLFDSKIGGTPYFPKDMEYPRGQKNSFEGQPLTLLAQLNFDELPSVPDFPKKGILQFFIAGDDLYGMSSDYGEGMTKQENFRVIYHKTVITDVSKLLAADEIPKYSGDEECYLPFSGEYKLIAHAPELIPATVWDFRFEDAFVRSYNEFADEPIESIWDLDDDISEKLYDHTAPDAVIGGYPVFAQDDPRSDESLSDCDVLLFELDSVCGNGMDIMWGDMGTGSFMISRERLKKLDFSRVLYNYDCG